MSGEPVGKGRPPVASRFKPGQSGNPKGRPRGRRRVLPYDTVLGQRVTVRENGVERQLRADEAFLLHITNRGLAGDGVAGRAALEALEAVRGRTSVSDGVGTIILVAVAPGSVTQAVEALAMGRLLDRLRPGTRMMLEPWLVEAALARFGARRLTHAQQQVVLAATRTPHKVQWPEWWTAK